MSGARRSRFLDGDRLARFADTAAEIGVAEVSRPWAETYIAIGVAFVVAHFANGGATTLAGAAAALLAAVGVSAVRRSEVPGLRTGSEVVLGGLMALAVVGAGRMVPTGIIAAITLVAGLALLRAVVAWEFHLRQIPGGATHRDRVAALAVSTLILFAASIGVAALVPGIITIPGTPSARPDAVGPFAILAVGVGSAIAAMLLAGRMASLRREPQAAIFRDALGAGAINGAASILFAALGAARLAGPAGLAILFYARELWAATSEGERRDQRLLLEIAALVLATAAAMLWIGVGR